jgi:hypothetical protein
MRGKTLLAGHALRDEGVSRYADDGSELTWPLRNGRAKCECGALSPLDLSLAAAKKWHSMHKDEIRKKLKAQEVQHLPHNRTKSSY